MATPEQKLAKLKALLETANADFATPEEIAQVAKSILDIFKEYRTEIAQRMAQQSDISSTALRDGITKLTTASARLEALIQGVSATADKRVTSLGHTVATQLSREIKRVEAKIPQRTDLSAITAEIENIRASLPDFATLLTKEPEAIRDSLELLHGDERLDKSAIKGLDELLAEIKIEGNHRPGCLGRLHSFDNQFRRGFR